MPQAFAGIRIIDFTQVLAGPFATEQLALLGAEVIKIEQPGHGDQTRGLMNDPEDSARGMSSAFMSCNLGKRSLTLDLKAPEAQAIVERLVKTADAVVENFRAGVMDRLGFGYEALKAIKPDLVYCSVSGYGQRGPKAGVPAYDGAIQADSGMMSITGFPETGPTRTFFFHDAAATEIYTAFALSAALYRRLATGEGQFVDVAMMDTAIVMQTLQIGGYIATGGAPELIGNRSPTGQPTANSFATSDGHINILALRDNQVRALFETIGCPEASEDERFASAPARVRNYDATYALIGDVVRTRTSRQWLEAFAEASVPAAEIRRFEAVLRDEQFDHRATFIEFPKPGDPGKRIKVVRAGFETDRDGPATDRWPPLLGEHSREILRDIGYEDAEIDALAERSVI